MKKLSLIVAILATVVYALPAVAQSNGDQATSDPAKRAQVVRTLDEITIEGEIAVPQVLFITARDVRRYRDGLEYRFRMTTSDVARSLDLPIRLRTIEQQKEAVK